MIMQHLRQPALFVDVMRFWADDTVTVNNFMGKRIKSAKVCAGKTSLTAQCIEVGLTGEPPIVICDGDYILLHSSGNFTAMEQKDLIADYGIAVRPGAVMH